MAPVVKAKNKMVWQPTQRKQIESPPVCSEPLSKQCSFGAVADSDEDHAPKTSTLKVEAFQHPCRFLRTNTASSDSTESGNSSLCGSLDSSSEDCCDVSPDVTVYTSELLVQLRGAMLRVHQLPAASGPRILHTEPRPAEEPEKLEKPATRKHRSLVFPKSSDGIRQEQSNEKKSKLPPASPNSWAEQQRLRRQSEETQYAGNNLTEPVSVSDAEMTRRIKSILNKLTPEMFATLYDKLSQVGVTEIAHIEILARLVFDEAVVQHTFSGMYADLCVYMIHDLGAFAAGAVLQEHLFTQCIQLLEGTVDQALTPISPHSSEDEEEAKVSQKKRLIGSTRFTGELIVRQVFPGHLLFTCTEWLLQRPVDAFNLERLAVLLTVVGPVLDNTMWPLHENLVPVFWIVRGLTFDAEVSKRVRCLLRDVVELREAGWVVAGSKVQERPMTLDEVRRSAGNGRSKKKGNTAGQPVALDLASMTAAGCCEEHVCSTWDFCDAAGVYQGFHLEGLQYQCDGTDFVFDQQLRADFDDEPTSRQQADLNQQQSNSGQLDSGVDSGFFVVGFFTEQGETA